ncbi:ABC transporter permease [Parvimonas micra]|uniref:ABC transporter permease n=1 Tax=Parvimonas micra TaxID=33033 RepID=A0A9X3HFZ4_9FIRM|nr:ABC transporter permease [Parvimonas micra]MCZ7407992.1 ABC transporter permease [Parvimonas micra]MCZ7411088.1 ABC transporter permease [Parvimonas micra]MCZ7412754.1 ABC transporter permease [Parvimonas micra]WBB36759.1 ABC transporter permease [Parvimonas micra]
MCNLFLKYFIKQKKNILFLIIIIIFGTVMSSVSKIENNKTKEEQIFSKERAIEIFKQDIKEVDKDLENDNVSDEEKTELNNIKKRKIKIIKGYEETIQDIKDENWHSLYERELNHFLDSNGNFISKGFGSKGISFTASEVTVEITYKVLKYLIENNIPSAYPLNLQRTEFDQPRTSEEEKILDYYSKKTLVGTSHRLWDFFTNNLLLIYTFIIVVTFGILFSKLEESQNKTIRFLRTSGASKFRIVSSGLFTGGILTIILGLLIPAIFFGIEFLISGSSSFKYPITTYIVKSNYFSLMSFGYKIVPISDVLIKSLILFLLYGLFIFLFTSTISTFVKSSVKSVILSFGLIATLQMFNKWYNPFSYWRVGKIADGSINFLFKTITYSFDKSCKILAIGICILTILLICIAFIQDRRRNGYA